MNNLKFDLALYQIKYIIAIITVKLYLIIANFM